MANFRQRRTFNTDEPLLKVDAGLPVGTHVFQLVVEDQNGNRSQGARIKLTIVETRGPSTPNGDRDVVTFPVVSPRPIVR